jgi:inner membrane protein
MNAARDTVAAAVARLDPGERLLDTALSAYPANPLCWSFVTVATDAAHGSYHLRRGLLSVAPGVAPVASCPAGIAGRAAAGTAQLAWQGDERDSLARLRDLQRNNCYFNAWMRFARAPSIDATTATDARWSPLGTVNFSTMDYADRAAAPCPHPVPHWGFPRADLLRQP